MSGTNIELKRILLPTDFSAASAQAVPYAVSFARQFGASIMLVYVVPTALPAELSHIGIVLEEKRFAQEAEAALALPCCMLLNHPTIPHGVTPTSRFEMRS
jgi:nucleotide-binding universal stress UspA family protein